MSRRLQANVLCHLSGSGQTEDEVGRGSQTTPGFFSPGNNRINVSNQVINAGDGWGCCMNYGRCQILLTSPSPCRIRSGCH